jgi:hypothetical protein
MLGGWWCGIAIDIGVLVWLVVVYLACCHVIALGSILDGLLNLFGLKLNVCTTNGQHMCLTDSLAW